jgi:hypothetical protein
VSGASAARRQRNRSREHRDVADDDGHPPRCTGRSLTSR